MKKKAICFIIILSFLFGTTGAATDSLKVEKNVNEKIVSSLSGDQKDQENYRYDMWWGVYGTNVYLAQSFTPSLNIITRVILPIMWHGTPDGIKISIRNSLNGDDLTSMYLDRETIEADHPDEFGYFEFDVDDISVESNELYYIVWKTYGATDNNNMFFWGFKDGNYYKSGVAWKYLQSNWQIFDPQGLPKGDPDFSFVTYGTNNDPPSIPSQPVGPQTGIINQDLSYESSYYDENNDPLEVLFDWGDGTDSGWLDIGFNQTYSMMHSWNTNGSYQIKTKARDEFMESEWSESFTIIIGNLGPNKPQRPIGPTNGNIGVAYSFSTSTSDVNNDEIFYKWDFGDGEISDWVGPYYNDEPCEISHNWNYKGEYQIKVKAKDIQETESDWSEALQITMPKNRHVTNVLNVLLDQYMYQFPVLTQIVHSASLLDR